MRLKNVRSKKRAFGCEQGFRNMRNGAPGDWSVTSHISSFINFKCRHQHTGAHPYPGMSPSQVISGVKQGYRLPKPDHCSDET